MITFAVLIIVVALFGGGLLQRIENNGGLKAIVEKVWCGNDGCDSK